MARFESEDSSDIYESDISDVDYEEESEERNGYKEGEGEGERLELEHLLEIYPPQLYPDLQNAISYKKEFKELESDLSEKLPPGRGKYFKHQRFTHRYLRVYDKMIVISETGTGKSCEVLGFSEWTRRELEKSMGNSSEMVDEKISHFKKVYVIVKGKTQKAEFRNQIICKCSDGRYEQDKRLQNATTSGGTKRVITTIIKENGYRPKTYDSFYLKFIKKLGEYKVGSEEYYELIRRKYSNTIIWVDEAHNLALDAGDRSEMEEKGDKFKKEIDRKTAKKKNVYRLLWDVFHTAERSKFILSTATPMINSPNSLGSLINLVADKNKDLPINYNYKDAPDNDIRVLFPSIYKNKKISKFRNMEYEEAKKYYEPQFPAKYNFGLAKLKDLEPRLRGKISFIRSPETGAVATYMGDNIQILSDKESNENEESSEEESSEETSSSEKNVTYDLRLVRSVMSDLQGNAVLNAMGRYEQKGKNKQKGQSDTVYVSIKQASNFVFPDGSYGNMSGKNATNEEEIDDDEDIFAEYGGSGSDVAFRKYVEKIGEQEDNYKATPELKKALTYKNLGKYSSKFKKIVEAVKKSDGICFIYSEFTHGSGAILLALCLEHALGYERFNEKNSVFAWGAQTSKKFCNDSGLDTELGDDVDEATKTMIETSKKSTQKRLLSSFKPAQRYALLTKSTKQGQYEAMMELLNSYQNRHGKYLKVLIASRVGRDAINVSNVKQIHLVGPEWNESSMYQAISRGFRVTSHRDLVEEAILETGDPNAKIEVQVYKHAAFTKSEQSIDLMIYTQALIKDIDIKKIMRMLKQISIGCVIHYNRNVRPTDTLDYSATCDYDICRYKCFNELYGNLYDPDHQTDYSTYDILYAGDNILSAIGYIRNIFKQVNTSNIQEIVSFILQNQKTDEIRYTHILMALERIISSNMSIVDRYGFTAYLREYNSNFYLIRDYPSATKDSYAMSYYTDGIIGIRQNSLYDMASMFEKERDEYSIKKLKESILNNSPRSVEFLRKISVMGLINLLEDSIIKNESGNDDKISIFVEDKLSRYVYKFNKPINAINKILENKNVSTSRRGRPPKPGNRPKIGRIDPKNVKLSDYLSQTNTPMVYLHTLDSQIVGPTSYRSKSRHKKGDGKIAIYDTSNPSFNWRNVNANEYEHEVYNTIIQLINIDRQTKFIGNNKYVGYIDILTDKLYIIGVIDPNKQKTNKNPDDLRNETPGRECSSIPRPIIIDILWHLQIDEPPPVPKGYKYNRNNAIKFLTKSPTQSTKKGHVKELSELKKWNDDKLRWYELWHRSKNSEYSREHFCNMIRSRMKDLDLLQY